MDITEHTVETQSNYSMLESRFSVMFGYYNVISIKVGIHKAVRKV
jgi:hypothetical protein